ncbi:MAG: hypothetical protein ACI8RD_004109 [Bacillariaceae sp.]|jgi:hypothetical protein
MITSQCYKVACSDTTVCKIACIWCIYDILLILSRDYYMALHRNCRYLDDIILDVPKSTGINGRPSQNIATMIDVRQRFGGSVQIIRKEDLCLGMSNTRFTLYRLSPYFNRAGVPGGADKFANLREAYECTIPGSFLYFDPTDDDYQDLHDYQDFH